MRAKDAALVRESPELAKRISAALDRRVRLSEKGPLRSVTARLALMAVMLAGIGLTVAFFREHYATVVECLYVLLGVAVVYLAYRRPRTPVSRAAALSRRKVSDVVSIWWFGAVFATACAGALAMFPEHIALSIVPFFLIAVAWGMASRPAMVTVVDPEVESLVDATARRQETMQVLVFAALLVNFSVSSVPISRNGDSIRFIAHMVAIAAPVVVIFASLSFALKSRFTGHLRA